MGCLAVLFALNEQELETFLNVERPQRAYYMHNELEENFWNDYPEYVCELDQAWDAMHRMLTDGSLNFENKFPPLCNVILGGEFVYGLERDPSGEVLIPDEEDDAYIILKTPQQVAGLAEALPKRTKEECRQCYDKIDEEDYGFAPYDEPQIAVTVMIPFGETSSAPAAVVAREIIGEYMGLNYEPKNSYMQNSLAQ